MAEGGTPLRQLFAAFTTSFDDSALKKGAAAVDGLFGRLQQIGSALAGGAIIGGIISLTKSVIHQGDTMSMTAERLGLATQALQQWTYVADLADVSSEELSAGLRILQKNIVAATEGGDEQAKAFKKLGIGIEDLKGKDLDAVLTEAADGFSKLEDPIKRTALAQQLFGRGGAALAPLLARGKEGIQELKEEFLALGGGLNDETIEAANQADDAFKRLRLGVRSLTANAMLPFIKLAIAGATTLKNWIVSFRQLSKGTEIVKAAIIALSLAAVAAAAPVLIAWAPVIATTLAWVAALTAAVLVVDDLITFFKGGQSVIGDWIEENFGPEASKDIIEGAKKLWTSFKEVFEDVKKAAGGEIFQDLKAGLREISALVKLIVDGIKFLNGVRVGTKALVSENSFLGKLGAPALSDKAPTPLTSAIAERAARIDAAAATPALGEQTSFFGAAAPPSAYGFSVADPLQLAAGAPSVSAAPSVPVAAPVGDAAKVQNILNVHVDANAKPDPQLVPMVKKAVTDALDQQNRETAAGM